MTSSRRRFWNMEAAIELTAGSQQTKITRYENSYNYFTFRRKGIS